MSLLMLSSATAALPQIFSPPYRSVLWKTLALTLALLAVAWVGLDRLIVSYIAAPYPWLATTLSILTGLGLFVGLAFLVAPVSSLVAGFFLDDLAELAERADDPAGPPGRALPAGQAVWLAARFALVSLLVNVVALLLLLVPGVNVVAFLGANAYLLGREYFELAAMRYRPIEEAREMRRRNAAYLFLAGLPIAAFLAVPVLNLLTPLFGAAYMVRIHKRLSRREASRAH
ncbi:MAG TPA: sulfate transporter family protein [Beijerinckiaceae bacterium]